MEGLRNKMSNTRKDRMLHGIVKQSKIGGENKHNTASQVEDAEATQEETEDEEKNKEKVSKVWKV